MSAPQPLHPSSPKSRRARRGNADSRHRKCFFKTLEVRRMLTGTISGTVFEDLNGDGIQDPGEPGIVGLGDKFIAGSAFKTIGDRCWLHRCCCPRPG